MSRVVASFAELEAEFNAYVGSIGYATMVTVDSRNRPRTRILIPVWENVDGQPRGWLATYRTPVKAAHLARNPHTSFSYWKPGNNSVAVEAVAEWVDDVDVKSHVWRLYRNTSPRGAGYDLGAFWRSPSDPKLHVLRLEPWRIQVIRGADLRSRIWRSLPLSSDQARNGDLPQDRAVADDS
ncbi:pyridoxamine 5'-phosphate oxidase family protein [Amycolatopsis tucumanensis]|uniref:Pyridoxamine 5'-phosphate oxidase N-terminal domain-containing protein n=1 Tax=Amycolatopsis tucumanensis TaxID=401106 RepID=A0ABP7HWX6_9PSEU|nr:pyridoxamine 5'-phosphate oxidase family protein [Amycolatopsis tucumanensis]MCF6422521.1 pyridoxamine 5'-phosphate oxidase family protein [Amycolatopsis tucumanensis]